VCKLSFSSLSWHRKCSLQYHGVAHEYQSQTGTTARVTYGMLDTVYGNKAVSWIHVWVNGFNRFTVTWDIGHNPSSGWLTTAQNTNSFKSSRTDGQTTERSTEDQQPTDWETNHQIICTDFGNRKISVKFVLHNLTNKQKDHRVTICE